MNKAYTEIAAHLRDKSILEKNELTFVCEGTSMNPMLKNGDEILVHRVPLSGLRFGDIITYESNGMFVTHRFFYKQKDEMMIIKADNRLRLDKLIPASSLIGKVIKISRNNQTIEIKPFWYFVSYLVTLLSLIEGHFFELMLAIKKLIFRHSDISKKMKQRLTDALQKLKQWFLQFLFLIIRRR